jgi:hypothetical protein
MMRSMLLERRDGVARFAEHQVGDLRVMFITAVHPVPVVGSDDGRGVLVARVGQICMTRSEWQSHGLNGSCRVWERTLDRQVTDVTDDSFGGSGTHVILQTDMG